MRLFFLTLLCYSICSMASDDGNYSVIRRLNEQSMIDPCHEFRELINGKAGERLINALRAKFEDNTRRIRELTQAKKETASYGYSSLGMLGWLASKQEWYIEENTRLKKCAKSSLGADFKLEKGNEETPECILL